MLNGKSTISITALFLVIVMFCFLVEILV